MCNARTLEEIDRFDIIEANLCSRETIPPSLFEEMTLKRWNVTWSEWLAVAMAFFLNVNGQMKHSIDDILNASLHHRIINVPYNPTQVILPYNRDSQWPAHPERTLSMPFRWGDKCFERQSLMLKQDIVITQKNGTQVVVKRAGADRFFIAPEQHCISLEQYMLIAETIRMLDPEIDTIILTSESKEVIDALFSYFILKDDPRYPLLSNTSEYFILSIYLSAFFFFFVLKLQSHLYYINQLLPIHYSNWSFIVNVKDIMPGIGIINRYDNIQKAKAASNAEKQNSTNTTPIPLDYYAAVLSQLSTFRLQMYAKYYITMTSSKWLDAIWLVANGLCSSVATIYTPYQKTEAVLTWGRHLKRFNDEKWGGQILIDDKTNNIRNNLKDTCLRWVESEPSFGYRR
ncbi:hypothetical protein RFI_31482 [Reticulomyxa filosa]|uniref:Uncharacterized protein n=1 Tax=Reticulomyxa filosa TaxID=46433 RepID=X6LX60_RETFI|nr:hypothetical protein RFI_31482 [Reticulomyxa filosa]|eukprot:ETO05916.1 hypothetical protein RFI_31482 [Reticulomyxa filosa]